MPMINGTTVPTYLVTNLAALPVGDAIPVTSLLNGQADEYQFRFRAVDGSLTLAGASSLATYDLDLEKWTEFIRGVGIVSRVILAGEYETLLVQVSVHTALVAIVMPGVVDDGDAEIQVLQRIKGL